MSEFVKILGSSIGSSVLICAAVGWLCREWISSRIRNSIQHEYDEKLEAFKTKQQQELEGYKAGYQKLLSENEIRFSRWHEEKANAIKELFVDIAELSYELRYLCAIEIDPQWDEDPEIKHNQRRVVFNRFMSKIEKRHLRWECYRLFIDDKDDVALARFNVISSLLFGLYTTSVMNNALKSLQKEAYASWRCRCF